MSYYSEKGVNWNTYNEIIWKVYNPKGTVATGENYDAYENVIAGYGMFQISFHNFSISGGIRIESTDQGYNMKYPIGEPQPNGNQIYTDLLPSIHLKYAYSTKTNSIFVLQSD